MKQIRRWPRILILSMLSISVFAPIIFLSNRLTSITSVGRREFIEDLSNIRFRTDGVRLAVLKEENGEGLKGPRLILFKDGEYNSLVRDNSSDTQSNEKDKTIVSLGIEGGIIFSILLVLLHCLIEHKGSA